MVQMHGSVSHNMTDSTDEQSMEAILRRIRQLYEKERLQEQGGESEPPRLSVLGRVVDPTGSSNPARLQG